jgi:hypothetical protein
VQLTILASARERTSMSFSRHEEIYRSDVKLGKPGSGNCGRRSQRSSAAMSFQSAIPWQVALRQSLPPLHRLATILNNPICRTMIFQRTATIPLTSCLTPWVHFTSRPFPLHPKSLPNLPPLRSGTSRLADSEHLLHNHHASVASLRLLFTFAPECRSASLRNRCSPSPEYPVG